LAKRQEWQESNGDYRGNSEYYYPYNYRSSYFQMGASGKAKGTGMNSKWGKFCGSCHVNAMAKDFTFMAATK